MILVTGGSGWIGRRVGELLGEQGAPLRLMARDTGKVTPPPGAEAVQGDYADPASLDAAFRGVESAFIVSGYAREGERAKLHGHAISAASRAGVRKIVYLSFQGASPSSQFPMARDHYRTEQSLLASGVPFVALRDNLYTDILPHLFDAEGVVRGPAGDGRMAFVAREDVAQTVAAALVQRVDGNQILDVTGPESLTFDDVADRLSARTGRHLRYERESVEEGRRWRAASGAPDWEVDTWLGSYLAAAAGELADVSDTVQRLTGRPPMTLEQYFDANPHILEPLRAT